MKTERTYQLNVPVSFDDLLAVLDQFNEDELRALQGELTARLRKGIDDLIDKEFLEYARQQADNSISLETVRAIWAKSSGSLSAEIIAEREDRI